MAYQQTEQYYLQRVCDLPVGSWVWMYRPGHHLLRRAQLTNPKLTLDLASPNLSQGMANSAMANLAKVNCNGQIEKKVHGAYQKVGLCRPHKKGSEHQ